jgi:hypothetical protein
VAVSDLWFRACFDIDPRVWCHLEPCWSHGVALAKAVAVQCKACVQLAAGLTGLLKQQKMQSS